MKFSPWLMAKTLRMDQNLNLGPGTLKMLDTNMGKTLQEISVGIAFFILSFLLLYKTPKALTTKPKRVGVTMPNPEVSTEQNKVARLLSQQPGGRGPRGMPEKCASARFHMQKRLMDNN